MGRILLRNAVVAFIAAVVGVLAGELFDHEAFWGAVKTSVWMFVGFTVAGTVREWQRSRSSEQ